MTDPVALLNARYVAVRTAEAKGLTDRLVQASRDKSPELRRILAPLLIRFWRTNPQEGWRLLERIAEGSLRAGGLPNLDVLELFGTVSVGLLNEVRHDQSNLVRLGRVWQATFDRLLYSPLGYAVRLMGRGWILRRIGRSAANALQKQPAYQPLNYAELQATFDRADEFRAHWLTALGCLEDRETSPGPIMQILSNQALPFDLYLMLVCERALICYGVHAESTVVMGVLEELFHNGAPWFRQSVLYALLHILTARPDMDPAIQDRYNRLALEFYRSDSWRMQTSAGNYVFAIQLAYADAVADRFDREASVLPQLLDEAIAEGDERKIDALFDAIDGLAVGLGRHKLALEMLNRAYLAAGKRVAGRAVKSLATVRLLDEARVDTFVQQHTGLADFAPETLGATEPSVRGEDINSQVDQFVVETMLNSNDFHAQLCRAFRRALRVRTVDEFLVQILQWIRDELGRMPAT
ncbi:MAG: hypothetical protein JO152_06815 [Mycobacteriaceae bacterium]|nr:hypothetical protein [Mycobacteriaceae bacterium]